MKKLDKRIIQLVKEAVEKLKEKDTNYYTIEDNRIVLTAVVANGKVSICFVLNKNTGTFIKNYLLEKIKVSIGKENS